MNGNDLNDSQNQNFGDAKATPDPALEPIAPENAAAVQPNEPPAERAISMVDYNALSKAEMVQALKALVHDHPAPQARVAVEAIKSAFYRKHKQELDDKRSAFVEKGAAEEDFAPEVDDCEVQLKELMRQYRQALAQHNHAMEEQKQENLKQKRLIIDQIKALLSSNEVMNQTYQEFRNLQQQWREVGPVPQAEHKNLRESYNLHVQNFYDWLKINHELRDMDLKRNLEAKTELCEKAENLMVLEPSSVEAFNKLQKFHEQWREIGPVPNEHRTAIWERFKAASHEINKRHQAFFDQQREEQRHNREAKLALCEKAEAILATEPTSMKEMLAQTDEMLALQQVWKTIGPAPKKDSTKLYERFRTACNTFFERKRMRRSAAKEEQQNNLQLKTELCIQAEALKDSTEWKKATEEVIALQKRWREIGPVPRKHKEPLWQRFRSACDEFFANKNANASANATSYAANLVAKEALIAEVEAYVRPSDAEQAIAALRDFQRRWASIGFVPMKSKEAVQNQFRAAIAKHFEALNVEEDQRELIQLKSKMEEAQNNPRKANAIRQERDRLFAKMKQLEADIALWENNIGFFAKSKNAEPMIRDVERKIAKTKEDIARIVEKIKLIDNHDK
ncbi:MAG: DUF349 domain-containing protein [Bacteroidales bacterium]|nr:DUF349 domain-containing protein [Bacteroidales bacterium]